MPMGWRGIRGVVVMPVQRELSSRGRPAEVAAGTGPAHTFLDDRRGRVVRPPLQQLSSHPPGGIGRWGHCLGGLAMAVGWSPPGRDRHQWGSPERKKTAVPGWGAADRRGLRM